MEEDVYDNFLMTFQKLFTKPRMYRFHYTRKKTQSRLCSSGTQHAEWDLNKIEKKRLTGPLLGE